MCEIYILKKLKKETLDKKVWMVFGVLFVYFEIPNLSQKTLTQIIPDFWDTSIPPMRNVGSQLNDN